MNLTPGKLADQARKYDELNGHLTFRISHLSKLLEVEAALRLGGSGFNLTSYRMMMVIEIFDEITVSDLSRIMLIDRAQISRAASDLIERGVLLAGADRSSKRKKLLRLSEDGKRAFDDLRFRFDDRQKEIESLLAREDLNGLWNAIETVSDHLVERIEAG